MVVLINPWQFNVGYIRDDMCSGGGSDKGMTVRNAPSRLLVPSDFSSLGTAPFSEDELGEQRSIAWNSMGIRKL